MNRWNAGSVLILTLALSGTDLDLAAAHRELFTPEEKDRLKVAERVYLETLVLTDRGTADPAGIAGTTSP